MDKIIYGLIVAIAGSLNNIQAGANKTLGETLNQPILAALIVSAVAIAAYLLVSIFTGLGWQSMNRVQQVPWWAWTGGAMGAFYVLTMIYLADKLGAGIYTAVNVTAAIVTSVVIDHFGLVGFEQHSINIWRIAGCILMIGGLSLISIF